MLKATAIGRLTEDPQLKYTPSGKAVCGFRLACDQGREHTEYISVVTWDKLAEVVNNNLQKGRLIYLEGRLQQREYDKQDGSKGRVTEIIGDSIRFLDYRKETQEESPPLFEGKGK